VIAIDVRRYVKRVVETAEFAAGRGAQLIVLSDSTQSPLFGATPLRLCASTTAVSAFETYVGLMLAVDIITNLVIAAAPDIARRRLSAGEEIWHRLGVFTPVRVG
jgi:DNA-binding MurR/RpiR family transcriptional regulator